MKALVESLAPIATFGFVMTENSKKKAIIFTAFFLSQVLIRSTVFLTTRQGPKS